MTGHLFAHAIQIAQAAHVAHAAHAGQAMHAVGAAHHAASMLAAARPTPGPTATASAGGRNPVLSGEGGATGAGTKPAYDEALRNLLNVLIFLANLMGGVIIGVAIIREALYYLYQLARHGGRAVPDKEEIRLSLGRSLALALEFQLGADILGTALDPSLQDLLVLAAIALLRTFLNYSLGREIDAETRRVKETSLGQGTGTPAAGTRASA